MTKRDLELDQILQPLKDLQPSLEEMQSWQRLAKTNSTSAGKNAWMRNFVQLAVAAGIGFLIGAAIFHQQPVATTDVAVNFDSSATIDQVFVKGN